MVSFSGRIDTDIRERFYMCYAALLLFYHGIHKTGLFDAGFTVALVMITFMVFKSIHMMNILLIEYFVILFIHFINLPGEEPIVLDRVNVTRLLLHTAIVVLIYYIIIRAINERMAEDEENRLNEERVEKNDAGMEDFLSNISHELRKRNVGHPHKKRGRI